MSDNFAMDLEFDTTRIPIEPGIHRAKVIDIKKEQNKAKDGDNLVFTFEVVDGPSKGAQTRLWQSLKPSVKWKYTEVIAAFGVDVKAGQGRITRATFMGKIVRIQVVEGDTDNGGEAQRNIQSVLPDDPSSAVPAAAKPQSQAQDLGDDEGPKTEAQKAAPKIDQGLDDFPPEEEDLPF